MQIFNLTLSQMLLMFSLILIGFFLKKKNIVPDNAYITLSRLETWVFVPALNFGNMVRNCSVENFSENSMLILYGTGVIAAAIMVAYPLSVLFVGKKNKNTYERNVYKYALTFGNYGFMGNFIVLSLWGNEMFFKYTMFNIAVTVMCITWGLFILIPKNEDDSLLKSVTKGIFQPPMIALAAGIVCGFLNLSRFIPQFLTNMLSNASGCMGPVAMLLAGIVIGGFDVKKLLSDKKIYIISLVRLIVLPAIFVTILKQLGASREVLTFALIAFGTPLGLNTIVYPAAYGGDTKIGASMAVVSHTLSIITIPLLYMLLVAY